MHPFKLLIFLFPILFFSCKKENMLDCVKRAGSDTWETRIVPPFTRLKIQDQVNVFITQGNTQEVKVEAGKNLISLVRTEVNYDVLSIKDDNKCNWSRSYKNKINVYVTVPKLTHINFDGSGQVKSLNTITGDMIDVLTNSAGDMELTLDMYEVISHLHGSTDMILHGKSNLHGIWHSGEGYLRCSDLKTDVTWTYLIGAGNEYLNAKDQLSATLKGIGDVYYSGNPTVNSTATSSGKLIHQR